MNICFGNCFQLIRGSNTSSGGSRKKFINFDNHGQPNYQRNNQNGTITDNLNVKMFDNAVPESLLEEVMALIKSRGFTYGWPSNTDIGFGHWNLLFGGFHKKSRNPIEALLPHPVLNIWRIIQPIFMRENPVLIRCYANSHTYGVEGYPHTDSNFDEDLTAVLYLNKNWKREWAGETVFFDNEEIICSIMPKYGRLVIFQASLTHVARSVSRICPSDRIVLVFKAVKDTRLDANLELKNEEKTEVELLNK